MVENLNQALLISAVGMGIVFIAILLLWALMALLVRIPLRKKVKQTAPEAALKPTASDDALRRKAVAAAVVTAIALHDTVSTHSSHAAREALTPWQSAHRSRLYQTGSQINRKK